MSRAPMPLHRYAEYCGPTTLAALLGCTRLEAAHYLTAEGYNYGNGGTTDWGRVLRDLGGTEVEVRTAADAERYNDAMYRYRRGLRRTPPKRSLARPTVAEVLRRQPEGLLVLWTTIHTLLARNGQVVADTKSTKSMRARVRRAYRFPDDPDVGLPRQDAAEIEREHRWADMVRRSAEREAAALRRP